jgi:amidase
MTAPTSRGSGTISRGFPVIAVLLVMGCAEQRPPFDVHEASVAEMQAAMEAGEATSVALVEGYLERILAFDSGPDGLNALIHLDSGALAVAAALDGERARGQLRGPLHGIPVLLKDNINTVDMPTTAGSIALTGMIPDDDAPLVSLLREAGAVILGKTNLHEFAFGYTTISSLGGQTRNAYAPDRLPGGSSGGTGAAIAASFASFGYGTDTCGSVRVPSALNGLYGLKGTWGLVNTEGIIPLALTQDVAGPLARSVSDLALAMEVVSGFLAGQGGPEGQEGGMTLDADALDGARLGVLDHYFGDAPEDEAVAALVREALRDLETSGAVLVDFDLPDIASLLQGTSVIVQEFRRDLDAYLAGESASPVSSLREIVEQGLHHPAVEGSLNAALQNAGVEGEAYQATLSRQAALRESLLQAMDDQDIDALVYPVVRRPAGAVGEGQGGVNCQLASATGFPALAMPTGRLDANGVPTGIELLARPFEEGRLLSLAYAWEQSGVRRDPPPNTPSLVSP